MQASTLGVPTFQRGKTINLLILNRKVVEGIMRFRVWGLGFGV